MLLLNIHSYKLTSLNNKVLFPRCRSWKLKQQEALAGLSGGGEDDRQSPKSERCRIAQIVETAGRPVWWREMILRLLGTVWWRRRSSLEPEVCRISLAEAAGRIGMVFWWRGGWSAGYLMLKRQEESACLGKMILRARSLQDVITTE